MFGCSNQKKVYWCGDHACINKKERKLYFEKTMTVEVVKSSDKQKKNKSEISEIIKEVYQENKKEIKGEKELAKQVRLEEKRRAKEEKELAKQVRLEEKRRAKEEKELAKQVRLEEKRRAKEEKVLLTNKSLKNKKPPKIKSVSSNTEFPVDNFNDLVKKVTEKNMIKPYPNINVISH